MCFSSRQNQSCDARLRFLPQDNNFTARRLEQTTPYFRRKCHPNVPVTSGLWDSLQCITFEGIKKSDISAFADMERLFLLLCLLFAILVGFGGCLECHECVTIESDTCLDPYNGDDMADNMNECDDGSHCVKYKTVIKLRDSGYIMGWERDSIVVTRACQPTNDLPTGCVKWQGAGGFTIKCRCDTDGCNSAPLLRSGVVMAFLSFVVVMLLLR